MVFVWITVVFIIITGLAALMLLIKPKLAHIEQFAPSKKPSTKSPPAKPSPRNVYVKPNINAKTNLTPAAIQPTPKEPSSSMREQLAFGDAQSAYFNDRINGEIILNPGIEYNRLPESLQDANINIPIPASANQHIVNRFFNDPLNQYTDADRTFCRSASHPSKLPKRPKGATVACGWWYVADPTVPSIGTLGTKDKPIFPDTLPGGGEWIWDIPIAIMKEDIKRCKQIKNCDLIDMKELKGMCGFCSDLGYSVPVDSKGTERFPDVVSCGTIPIRNSKSCPKPVAPIKTPEGHDCGTYGRSSNDGVLRLYTKEECSAIDSEASVTPDGQCIKAGGGSYSIDCRNLNAPVVNEPAICDPNSKGKLSRACLIYLCKGMGYTPAGAIMRILSDPLGKPNEMDKLAISIMNSIGVPVPNALIGGGDIDAVSAKNQYYKLMMATHNAKSDNNREAAKWLVFGTNKFDPCNISDSMRGPFIEQCIQREFRKAGCQPAGSRYPSKPQDFGKYYNYKWSAVKAEFAALRKNMSNPNGAAQDIAVQQCLGIGVRRESPKSCITGIWQKTDNPADKLSIAQSGTTLVVQSSAGAGTINFNDARQTGTYTLRLTKGGSGTGPFSVMDNTIFWGAGRTPYNRVSR